MSCSWAKRVWRRSRERSFNALMASQRDFSVSLAKQCAETMWAINRPRYPGCAWSLRLNRPKAISSSVIPKSLPSSFSSSSRKPYSCARSHTGIA
jgi:hypothetical protein